MQLEDYFEFLDPDDIRLKGHCIGIQHVIEYYLQGYTVEQILTELPTLNLEKIHATITYYLHHRAEMDAYLLRLARWREQQYHASIQYPSLLRQRLQAIKAEREQKQLNLL
jgi:uncharacterized protein (DUF433 family)